VVVLGPRHPWEEVVIAGVVDRVVDLFSVSEVVGADDESVGFKLAAEGLWGGPVEAYGGKVVL
jgi:hypothetical protein